MQGGGVHSEPDHRGEIAIFSNDDLANVIGIHKDSFYQLIVFKIWLNEIGQQIKVLQIKARHHIYSIPWIRPRY